MSADSSVASRTSPALTTATSDQLADPSRFSAVQATRTVRGFAEAADVGAILPHSRRLIDTPDKLAALILAR